MKTTLPPRSQYLAEELAAVTQAIRELVDEDLAMLILFGSYARGDWVQDRYQEDLFNLLKAAYIDARYKRDYKITQEELDYLASRVRKLQEFAQRICEERIAGMVQ